MNYKQSKTPYLSIVVVMALIAGITHLRPQNNQIEISIGTTKTEMHLTAKSVKVENTIMQDINLQNQKPYETTRNHSIVFVVD
jgi:hypothetical protein